MRLALPVLIVVGMLAGCSPSLADSPSPATRPVGVAVVELFTSEGCSSCPPADEVLGKLVAEHAKAGSNVFALAFHVDYWDRIGWKDRFSDHLYSQRQRDYAAAAKTRQVYTPQMIVNGDPAGFVGSEEETARRQIAAAIAKPALAQIELKSDVSKGVAKVQYAVTGVVDGSTLNVAVVERDLSTAVPRGENAGRTLVHQNVVRVFRQVTLKQANGSVDLPLPVDLRIEHSSLIAFVQEDATKAVRGAAEASLAVTR